jgi:hypothetical protein
VTEIGPGEILGHLTAFLVDIVPGGRRVDVDHQQSERFHAFGTIAPLEMWVQV